MNIENNCVVSFHYRLRDSDDKELENSHAAEPLIYLHGHGGIIAGLEVAMAGHAEGDVFSATVAPDKAYGPRRQDAVQRIQMKHVLTKGKLKVGQAISINSDQGPRQVIVMKAGKFVVDVDTNHPLAGATLTFDIEIKEVRLATDEERAHNHAHGPGGHHH
jgi:FKBP-type peptidyl-prolyl cis-trans isomerase SlyD